MFRTLKYFKMKIILCSLALIFFSNISFGQLTVLHDFAGYDGKEPNGSLFFDGTYFYGLTSSSNSGYAVIYKIKPDGTSYSEFFFPMGVSTAQTPYGSLISDGTFLYGMTAHGGNSWGCIFKIKPDFTNYSIIYTFLGAASGGRPNGKLLKIGNSLYGLASLSGSNSKGTIFKINTDGTGFLNLHNFNGSDGSNPNGDLISDGTSLYGMTMNGGTNNLGVIFKISLDGSSYLKLHDFDGNTNGSNPYGSFISDGTYLYGMTKFGGINNSGNNAGTIFKIKPDGTDFSSIYEFSGLTGTGIWPDATLIFVENELFGTTSAGPSPYTCGSIFKINPDGSNFVDFYYFNTYQGYKPSGNLYFDGNFIYGTCKFGNTGVACNNPGNGVVYKIDPATASLNEKIANHISINPNPTSDIITVDFHDALKISDFQIFDLSGIKVLEGVISNGKNQISLSTLKSGLYIIHITGFKPTKLIKN